MASIAGRALHRDAQATDLVIVDLDRTGLLVTAEAIAAMGHKAFTIIGDVRDPATTAANRGNR